MQVRSELYRKAIVDSGLSKLKVRVFASTVVCSVTLATYFEAAPSYFVKAFLNYECNTSLLFQSNGSLVGAPLLFFSWSVAFAWKGSFSSCSEA